MEKKKRSLELDDFLKNRILGQLKVDNQEQYGAYLETRADLQTDKWIKHLWLINLRDFSPIEVDTSWEIDDFVWLPDVPSLLYGKSFSERGTQFFSYDPVKGTLSREAEISFRAFDFSRSGEKLYFTAKVKDAESTESVTCSETLPLFEEGSSSPGKSVTGLFCCDLQGRNLELITPPDMDVDLLDFDLSHQRILFSAYARERVKPVASFLYSFDLLSGKLSQLCEKSYRISGIAGAGKDLLLFFGVDLEVQKRNDNPGLYFCRPSTGSCKRFEPYLDVSNEHPAVVTDSYFSASPKMLVRDGVLYFKAVGRDREYLASLDIAAPAGEGPAAAGPSGERTARKGLEFTDTGLSIIGSFALGSYGTLLIGMKGLGLSELYRFTAGKTEQLTILNEWVGEIELSQPLPLRELIDGVEIDGYLYPPITEEGAALTHGPKAAGGADSPAVLMIHGGPKMLYAPVYAHDIQLLCRKGYYVFCANPMGSDGRGNDFLDIRGNFCELPYQQLMTFTDRVVERFPRIDPNRLGVSGGSYGGYMTNYIITRTKRFSAAVSERSISSLLTSYLSTDIGYHFGREYIGKGDDPWSLLIEGTVSPIHRADQVATPTLFVHGMNDYRCQAMESVNMYSALCYNGVESRICLFEGEGHGLVVRGRPQSKMRRYREFFSWFDRFIGDGVMDSGAEA